MVIYPIHQIKVGSGNRAGIENPPIEKQSKEIKAPLRTGFLYVLRCYLDYRSNGYLDGHPLGLTLSSEHKDFNPA